MSETDVSNFDFLRQEWAGLYGSARQAERYAKTDPRTSCFYARRTLEDLVRWLFENDGAFRLPYDTSLNALLSDSSFKRGVPQGIVLKAELIRKQGNRAVHDQRPIRDTDAVGVLQDLFQVAYWLVRTYRRNLSEPLQEMFDPYLLPPAAEDAAAQSRNQLEAFETQLEAERQAREQERALNEQVRAEYEQKLAELQAQVGSTKARNARTPDRHDYNEAQTRETIIDLMLLEAGWDVNAKDVREFPVVGLPTKTGRGRVDYVLWGDDGKPLAVVEAKRTSSDSVKGRQQAKLYADALEKLYEQRPLIFYTNGFETWLWDDTRYPPRAIQGYYTKDQLELLIQRRSSTTDPATLAISKEIADRPYQEGAIRRLSEHLGQGHRKALLVMATGTGKTRTTVAFIDVLMRAGWVKRVLFLADRKPLVTQAVKAFKKHLPSSSPVNLLEDKRGEGRVFVSTYHTMMGLIDERQEGGARLFGPGHFDLIIVDEAHRSIYRSFGAIFRYFDALLVGLTATPKDEVDRNTYELFELERGVPTFAYELDQAVADGYLVPPNPLSVGTRFMREGIRYDDLSDDEKDAWDEIEWDATGERRDEVKASDLNKWLFNRDTVDKVLQDLMERGQKVAGGDRLGKTILFAQNHKHAAFIEQRFNVAYPHYAGHFARVIDNYEPKAESLIEDFSKRASDPHLAISVDMLDTGIDVPEVVNLVFFKLVRSKTKFFQMLGRGTRLSPDLFGPGLDKESFNVFDYCQNFVFFNQNPKGIESREQEPLSQKLFKLRLELIQRIGELPEQSEALVTLADALKDTLHARVAATPLENFIVRPLRKYVEPFSGRSRWNTLSPTDVADLDRYVSGLPSQLPDDDETAKRFDVLSLQLMLAQVRGVPPAKRQLSRMVEIAEKLEDKTSVPAVKAKVEQIRAVQREGVLQSLDAPKLEGLRLELRELTQYLDPDERRVIYSDFEDELGEVQEVVTTYLTGGVNVAQYRKKVEAFLSEHRRDAVFVKVRTGQPITAGDLSVLEELFFSSKALESRETFEKAYGKQENLGLFIRRLTGLDRRSAQDAFARYLDGKAFSADQLEFVTILIEQFTRNGVVDPRLLYERPFTDLSEGGLDNIFSDTQADELVRIVQALNQAVALKA